MAISRSNKQKACTGTSIRLNLQLPLDLKNALDEQAARLRTTTPELARDFLKQGVEALKQKQLDEQLIAGYQLLASESRQLTEEFHDVDLEGWEEDKSHGR